jgi:hypothetical protein
MWKGIQEESAKPEVSVVYTSRPRLTMSATGEGAPA